MGLVVGNDVNRLKAARATAIFFRPTLNSTQTETVSTFYSSSILNAEVVEAYATMKGGGNSGRRCGHSCSRGRRWK